MHMPRHTVIHTAEGPLNHNILFDNIATDPEQDLLTNTAVSSPCQGQPNQQSPDGPSTPIAQSRTLQLSFYSSLLQQLDAVGWSVVADVASDLSSVELQLQDAAGRVHTALVQLPSGFPAATPAVSICLPKPLKLRWLPGHTLTQLVAQIQQALSSYQLLWEQLEDLDNHTQLLDPPQALCKPYSNRSRCIALGNGASCQLQLSAAAPKALPNALFHGPSSVVAGLQSSWHGSAHALWDDTCLVRQNLETVLQLHLPAPKPGVRKGCAAVQYAASGAAAAAAEGPDDMEAEFGRYSSDFEEDDDAGACAICYSLHLPDPDKPDELGEAANVECNSCKHLFHSRCLAEWLGALPDSRRVFDTLFGMCPFCQSSIGVSTKLMSHQRLCEF